MTEHVLTIDLGTSGPKVALFTLDGEFVDGDFAPVELQLLARRRRRAVARPRGGRASSRAAQRLMERATRSRPTTSSRSRSRRSGRARCRSIATATPLHDAIIWMDARGADDRSKRVVGGRGAGRRATTRASCARGSGSPAARPRSRARTRSRTSSGCRRERPEIARATWKYLEPKDWLNLKLTGRVRGDATTRSSCTGSPTTATSRASTTTPELLAHRPASTARSFPTSSPRPSVLGAAHRRRGRRARPARRASRSSAARPICSRPRSVRARSRDFEGHLYVGTSSWLTCHVPFKKTDLFHGIASLPSPLPGKYYVADEQEVAGACLDWLRDHVFFPDDALGTGRPDDVYRRFDDVAATAPPGSNGVIFTPWLNGERTPVDDHTVRAGWHNLSLATTRAELVRSVLEGVAFNSRWLLGDGREVRRPAVPVAATSSAAARSRSCGARSWPTCSTGQIRQVEHPIRANARGAALLAGLALGRIDGRRHRAQRARSSQTFAPDRANRARLRRAATAEFRAIHKQTKAHVRERLQRRRADRADRARPRRLVPDARLGPAEPTASSTASSIVSPHLDDAVLGCGRFMAAHPGVTVVTVFAGNPPAYPDVRCGYWDVQSGLRARRRRDGGAPRTRTAPRSRCSTRRRVHLDFVEHTYNPGDRPVAPDVLADGLAAALARARADARARAVRSREPRSRRDAPRVHARRATRLGRRRRRGGATRTRATSTFPGMLAWRVSSLFRRELWPTPVCPRVVDRRRRASRPRSRAIPTQLLALEDDWQIGAKLDAPAPEQFWRLAPPPAGWPSCADTLPLTSERGATPPPSVRGRCRSCRASPNARDRAVGARGSSSPCPIAVRRSARAGAASRRRPSSRGSRRRRR